MMARATRRRLSSARKPGFWELRLYVADKGPRCLLAYSNLRNACEEYLPGRYRIEVIDVVAHPEVARREQIVAVPTAVRGRPKPVRTAIGNFSDVKRLLAWLEPGQ